MLELDGTLIIAMISFVVFAFIMNAVLYQPILKIVEERKAYIAANTAAEQKADIEALNYREKRESELEESKKTARLTVSEGTVIFKNKQSESIKEFTENQRNMLDTEKQRLQDEAGSAKLILENSANELAEMITDKVLGKDRANV